MATASDPSGKSSSKSPSETAGALSGTSNAHSSPAGHFRVALVGNPNTGKSTLFNALAGLNVRTGNYPGVTIEKKIGRCQASTSAGDQHSIDFVDLPGTYSLAPRSPDEMVAFEVLTGDVEKEDPVDLILCVVNATMIRRNLFLVSQLMELGKPMIIVLNMIDASQARGVKLDTDRLAKNLGLPVIATSASRRIGIDELKQLIANQCVSNRSHASDDASAKTERTNAIPRPDPRSPLSPAFAKAIDSVMETLVENNVPHHLLPNPFMVQRALIDGQHAAVGSPTAETFLSQQFGFCITRAIADQRKRIFESDAGGASVDLIDRECDARYAWAQSQLDGVIQKNASQHSGWTDRIDALLTHRIFGLISFLLIMFVIFQSIYSFAGIPMDVIDGLSGWVSDGVVAAMPPGMLRSLITDGIIAGVGGVLIFLPQIALLFLFLALLEDCGYMARAAFVVDRMMSAFGLSGKSFLPLMSSFACAVPGVMATRVIESRRDRLTTIMVAPLMSCSARLPVYLLLIGAFVPATKYLGGWMSLPALVLMSMYLVGVVVAVPVAWILKKTILRGDAAPFVLELPEYKRPALRVVFSRVWQASVAFIVRAGTLIFAASILIWFAGFWPGDHTRRFELESQLESMEASEQSNSESYAAAKSELNQAKGRLIEQSLLGKAGHVIEPIVRPLGWDWKIGVGAIASFPAREVIIATLGTIYSLGGEEEDDGLIGAMRASKHPDGSPVYTLPVALSVMVFFALCAQCVSTLLVIRRETNSWFWPALSFTYMTVLAYVGAFVTFQVGSRLF